MSAWSLPRSGRALRKAKLLAMRKAGWPSRWFRSPRDWQAWREMVKLDIACDQHATATGYWEWIRAGRPELFVREARRSSFRPPTS